MFDHNLSLLTLTQNKEVCQFTKIHAITEETRRTLTSLQSRHQIQKMNMLVLITTIHNENTRKPITVMAGDSIIQNIRSSSISKSSKVVVSPFRLQALNIWKTL